MEAHYDVLIAGAGLAGACAALALSRRLSVLLLEAQEPAAGASGAAAGLANPVMGRRPRLVWRVDEALAALHDVAACAGVAPGRRGILRPAQSERQATAYQHAADAHPEHAAWWPAAQVGERCPDVEAPRGALFVSTGLTFDIGALVRGCVHAAQDAGATVQQGVRVEQWVEDGDGVRVQVCGADGRRTVHAARLILATGQDAGRHPEVAALSLKRIKGQTVTVRLPEAVQMDRLPALGGSGYVVPGEEDTVILGSSYEHQFDDLNPSPAQTHRILEKTSRMLPVLRDAQVLEARAGARVKVPSSRYPLVDRLPEHRRTWLFTALGSKGLLMAPMLARRLAAELSGRGEGLPPHVKLTGRI